MSGAFLVLFCCSAADMTWRPRALALTSMRSTPRANPVARASSQPKAKREEAAAHTKSQESQSSQCLQVGLDASTKARTRKAVDVSRSGRSHCGGPLWKALQDAARAARRAAAGNGACSYSRVSAGSDSGTPRLHHFWLYHFCCTNLALPLYFRMF